MAVKLTAVFLKDPKVIPRGLGVNVAYLDTSVFASLAFRDVAQLFGFSVQC